MGGRDYEVISPPARTGGKGLHEMYPGGELVVIYLPVILMVCCVEQIINTLQSVRTRNTLHVVGARTLKGVRHRG